jgi:hypothetical protein
MMNSAAETLTEPLLASQQESDLALVEVGNEETEKTISASAPSSSGTGLDAGTRTLAFVLGCTVAVWSQAVLTVWLWSDQIFTQSACDVILFSLHWSFWTCAAVFGMLLTYVHVFTIGSSSSPDESLLFQLEVHYVLGALASICAVWFLRDISTSESISTTLFVVSAVMSVVAALLAALQQDNRTEVSRDNLHYNLAAGLLGSGIGAGSQCLLGAFLWRSPATIDANVVVFSLAWSTCTVALTFCGCYLLRRSVTDSASERTALRMEAVYIGSGLTGICLAWILMDLFWVHMPEQVLPSLGMLALSLMAFFAILKCFPEDACLEELEAEKQELFTRDALLQTV